MGKKIFIIGGGFAGALTALHLLRMTDHEVELAEPGPLALGVSFAPPSSEMVLNVPASRMGALPQDPGEFDRHRQRWPDAGRCVDGIYASRNDYGRYLSETVARELVASPRFHLRAENAYDLTPGTDELFVELPSGRARADAVVLACGSLTRSPLFPESSRVISDPWARKEWFGRSAGRVLLIGTGLTAVDLAIYFLRAGSHVTALSRHGLLPFSRSKADAAPLDRRVFVGKGLRSAVRLVRKLGSPPAEWRGVVEGLRPFTNELWTSFSEVEKRRFVRHASSYWSVCRHRIPDSIAAELDASIESGALRVLAGRVLGVDEDGVLTIDYRPRGARSTKRLEVDLCVSCLGPSHAPENAQSPLFQALLQRGLIEGHRCGVGLRMDGGFRVHSPLPLYTLGHWLRGERWESNAVPELRAHAEELAEQIAADFGRSGGSTRPKKD